MHVPEYRTTVVNDFYRSHFISKRLLLTADKVTKFEKGIRPGGLFCLLAKLVLVAPLLACQADAAEQIVKQRASTLRKAWHGLHAHADGSRLRNLVLEVDTRPVYEWYPISGPPPAKIKAPDPYADVLRSAAVAYRVATTVLVGHGEPLSSLELFSTLPRCSLPLNELQRFTMVHGPLAWLSQLQHLSLSISCTNSILEHPWGRPKSEPMPEDLISSHEDAKSVLRLLRATPNLTSLDVKFYDAYHESSSTSMSKSNPYDRFDLVAVHVRMPQLSTLQLRGVRISSRTLRGFLTRHPLRFLTLEQIQLQPCGRLKTVLDSISGPKRKIKLERLIVADIWEDSLMSFSLRANYDQTSGALGDGEGIPQYAFIGEQDQLEKTVTSFPRYFRSPNNIDSCIWKQYSMIHFSPPLLRFKFP